MRLICNGLELSEAAQKVLKAVSVRTTNPILEGIKIKAEGETLTLTATDMELAIEKKICADIKMEGEIVVPGKLFSEFIKKITDQQIELMLDDSNLLTVKYAQSFGTFACLDANEYPEIKEISDGQFFSIVRKEFRDFISKLSFCVSQDESRPVWSGILFDIEDYCITGVALDGYRMAKCIKPIEKSSAKMRAIVPARCLNEISRILDDSEELIKICIQKNYLLIDLVHTKMITRLIEGDFIDYNKLIPAEFETSALVPRAKLEDAVERANLMARFDKNNEVRFELKENTIQVSSNSTAGNVHEFVPVSIEGKDITMAFSAKFVTELLKTLQDSVVRFRFKNGTSPCVVVPNEGEEYTYLLLPVRMV